MRFNEFKNVITEAQKGNQADVPSFDSPGYFTVGDSHSNGVGNYGRGKTWKAMGMDGASAFDPMHTAAIAKIPAGSVVAISLGANDLSSKPIPQIVSQVNKVIGDAKEKGLEVVYLLPTATTDVKKKSKRDELRQALSAAINVPTYDLGTVKGGDGLHQPMNVYGGIANQISREHTPNSKGKLGAPDQKPGSPTTKDRIKNSANLEQGPPFPEEQKDEVKRMQSGLQDLGYSLGRLGVDGKYGPATAAAVAAFKKDYKIDGSASSFSEKDFNVLAQISSGQIKKVDKPTRVTDYESPNIVGTKERNAAFKEPLFMEKLKKVSASLGVTEKDLIGIMKHESGLNPRAVNPYSKAVGLIQFMPKTARSLGTSSEEILKMSATEQLDLVEKYYRVNGVKPGDDIADLYMLTFMPAARDKPDSFVLGDASGGSVFGLSKVAVYKQNKAFDSNSDGVFTVGDVKDRIRQFA